MKNRVKELVRIRASEIRSNPLNPKLHPTEQKLVMEGLLGEIGMADALIVRRLPDGGYELLDGHMRQGMVGDMEVPCLVVDLDDEEAAGFLLSFDMTKLMATRDDEMTNALLDRVAAEDGAVRQMLDEMANGKQTAVKMGKGGESSTRTRPQTLRIGKLTALLSNEEAARLTLIARRYSEATGSFVGFGTYILNRVKAKRARLQPSNS